MGTLKGFPNPPARRWRRGCLGLLLLAGCARLKAGPPIAGPAPVQPPRPRADWLDDGAAAIWARHLGQAQRALLEVADREVRHNDPALDYWSELLALLRCEPLRGSPRSSRTLAEPWDQLRRIVQIERLRLPVPADVSLLEPSAENSKDAGKGGAAPLPAFQPIGRTVPVSPPPAEAEVWPLEGERWPDEAPAARKVLDLCRGPREPGRGPREPDEPAGGEVARTGADAAELMMVSELTSALPDGHPALPSLLFEQAALSIAAGDARAALAPLGRLTAGTLALSGAFSPEDLAQLILARAIAADADAAADAQHRGAAIPTLQAALAADLPHDVRRVLGFRLAEQMRAAGRTDEAVAAIGPPPHGDDALGRYLAFRQVEAHVKAGRRAEALAEARAALGKHRRTEIDGHTALAAIDDFAMRLLVGSPVSDETIEVLEAIGDPAERVARVERFALMAEAGNAYASAVEAFLWLMKNDPDENRRLHHLARASVAAARAGDRVQFGRTFAMLAGEGDQDDAEALAKEKEKERAHMPPGSVPAADERLVSKEKPAKGTRKGSAAAKDKQAAMPGFIESPDADRLYRSRHRERSLSWQRAMLIVARDALPSLVESDDQANIKILVDRLQQHLTAHGRGPVDAELTTVYRAASAHLRSGARGYAERVGTPRRPILLGDIAVERKYNVVAPRIDLEVRGPGSLLWIPATGNDPSAAHLKRWPAPLGTSLDAAPMAEAEKP
jgi:tetratricopeptide (TPR) repeat protein